MLDDILKWVIGISFVILIVARVVQYFLADGFEKPEQW